MYAVTTSYFLVNRSVGLSMHRDRLMATLDDKRHITYFITAIATNSGPSLRFCPLVGEIDCLLDPIEVSIYSPIGLYI